MQTGITCGRREGRKDGPAAELVGTITFQKKPTCYWFDSKRKQKRTLLEFLKLFNEAGLLARRHPSKDSRVHQYLQERATGCLGQAFVPPSLHRGRTRPP